MEMVITMTGEPKLIALDRKHQQFNHPQHIVSRSRADGLVNESLAEPHHQQSEHHLPDACNNG